MKSSFAYISLAFFLLGCGKTISPVGLKNLVENPANGYIVSGSYKGIVMQCMYHPKDYQVVNSIQKKEITAREYEEAAQEIDQATYFSLKFEAPNNPDDAWKNYVNFQMQEDIRLVVNETDTLLPVLYHAEPYNGVTPFTHILLAFPRVEENSAMKVLLLQPDGIVSFAFDMKSLQQIPSLQIN